MLAITKLMLDMVHLMEYKGHVRHYVKQLNFNQATTPLGLN